MRVLALTGGTPAVPAQVPEALFHWPVVTAEDEAAVVEVMRAGVMSQTGVTVEFEREFAAWHGIGYALAHNNGTSALRAAMWACGVGAGDEVIAPAMAYWASSAAALTLGATVNFADIDPVTLNIDPEDIEHRIGPATRLIVVVHSNGYPADMDRIMAIARRHRIRVLEDASHAHGGWYRGRRIGTLGDIAAMSLMSAKPFPVGEGGMLLTGDRELYERAISFGHYERTLTTRYGTASIGDSALLYYAGIPLGAVKNRMNQMCSAMGRVQLRHIEKRIADIQEAMNYFWDRLEGVPGIRAHRVAPGSASTMGGWYLPMGLYVKEELDQLPCARFCEGLRAEGIATAYPGGPQLHRHPFFLEADLLHQGRPTALAYGQRDVRQDAGALPVTERIDELAIPMPWFKHPDRAAIDHYAAAIRKVSEHFRELL